VRQNERIIQYSLVFFVFEIFTVFVRPNAHSRLNYCNHHTCGLVHTNIVSLKILLEGRAPHNDERTGVSNAHQIAKSSARAKMSALARISWFSFFWKCLTFLFVQMRVRD
jgi:hypothetical protein